MRIRSNGELQPDGELNIREQNVRDKREKGRNAMSTAAGNGRIERSRMRQEIRLELEKEYPGYLEIDDKLHTIVRLLTGLRILYSLFYLAMTFLYGMEPFQAVMNLVSPVFFYLWYSLMLRSGKMVAVLMLLFRGISIVYGGVSVLSISAWVPYPLIFMLVLALVIEFVEAVFCIYTLFNAENAQTIRLNLGVENSLRTGSRNNP